jgi:hypothetical protein
VRNPQLVGPRRAKVALDEVVGDPDARDADRCATPLLGHQAADAGAAHRALNALAAGLYLVLLSVARASKKDFIPYAIALFVASVVFSGGLAVLRASQASQVQPAVALPKEARNPVCGIFVGETSDRLYFGRLDNDREDASPANDGDSGHLFWLSKDEVTAWHVGTLQDQEGADSVLSALRPRLLADRRDRRTIGVAITTEEKKRKVSRTRTVTKVPKAGGPATACSIYTPEP